MPMTDSLRDNDGCIFTVVHHFDGSTRVQVTLNDRYEGTEAVMNVSRSALLAFAKELIRRLETD